MRSHSLKQIQWNFVVGTFCTNWPNKVWMSNFLAMVKFLIDIEKKIILPNFTFYINFKKSVLLLPSPLLTKVRRKSLFMLCILILISFVFDILYFLYVFITRYFKNDKVKFKRVCFQLISYIASINFKTHNT